MQLPFRPVASTNLLVGATSAAAALPAGFDTLSPSRTVRLFNDGAVVTFVEFGASGVTASTTTSMALAPNEVRVFYPFDRVTHIAAIAATGTPTLRITTGEGGE